MSRVTIFNRLAETISYKMNANDTNLGPGNVIPSGESDGPHGEYSAGTTLTVWWRRGEVDVKTCNGPGCNGRTFQIQNSDLGVYLGEDSSFKEQDIGA